MENKEKKEYGGCLRILLPLWFLGQILSIFYNFAFANYYTEYPMIPIFLIGINIIELVGIILLLQFKKIGFYIFILSLFLAFLVGMFYPDYVDPHIISKSIFGLGFFLLLMCFKNKETKLNGYQTLGIIKSHSIIENNDTYNQDTNNMIVHPTNENINIARDNEDSKYKDENPIPNNQGIITPSSNKEDGNNAKMNSHNNDNISVNSSLYNGKLLVCLFSFLVIVIIAVIFIYAKDNRTNQEIYNDAKSLIDKKEYKEGIKELNKIENDFAQAKALLGKLYYYNDSVGINKELGEKLLWEAFEKNDTNASNTLIDIYTEKGDWENLNIIASKLDGLGFTKGSRVWAWLYWIDEIGGKSNKNKDYKKAEYYASKIANDDAYASFILGQLYCDGGDGIKIDYAKAFYWWSNGARLGDSSCYDNLGWCYFNGNGVNRNYKKAYESFIKAISIDNKDPYAYYFMALMFKDGLYVKANRDSLKFYLQKAKDYGDENALVMYENEF